VIDAMNRLLSPLRRRLDNMVARAVVRLVSDSTTLQSLQVGLLSEETREACERFQEYGFSSVPFPGAEAVVVFPGGYRDHPLVIAVDHREHRKTGMTAGEVALYTDEGDCVRLQRGRIVQVLAGTKVRVESPILECTGVVDVAGVIKVDAVQVVSNRGAAVTDASGGGTVDTQARTAINTLLARLRIHGLIEA